MKQNETEKTLHIKLDTLIAAVTRLVTLPLAPLAPLAPIVPANQDLLIKFTRLEENVSMNFQQVKDAIKELKDGTTAIINDHELRIRSIESKIWIMVGGLTILSFISPYIWSLFK